MSTASPQPAEADSRLSSLLDAVRLVVDQNRSLLESIQKPASSSSSALSADQVRGLIDDALSRHHASTARSTARASFEREHCTDLPDAYRRLLPETDDPAALADAEQSIRAQFRNDLKQARRASGDSLSSSADESGRGLPPAAAIDYARLTPLQQIAVGLKRAKAGRPTEVRTVPPAPVDEESDEPLFVGAD